MLNTSTSATLALSKGGWGKVALSCLILGLIAGDVSGCAPSASQSAASVARTASAPPPPRIQTASTATAALPDFAGLVERFGRAVVNVEITGHAQTASMPLTTPEDDPFSDFFRRFGIPAPVPRGEQAPILRGSGSGFIVSPDGYILTNAHVVQNADEVRVRLTDRREFQAKVIGSDGRTDVAVIKIDAKDLRGEVAKIRDGGVAALLVLRDDAQIFIPVHIGKQAK